MMTEKEKADVMVGLAKAAYDRFDQLAAISWKLRLSVWIALGAATGFILSSDKWKPSLADCILGTLATLGIVVAVVFLWGPHTYSRSSRFSRIAQYWESAIEELIQVKLPPPLDPAALGTGGHFQYGSGDKPDKPLRPWYRSPIYLSQALITTLFGLLVIGAMLGKAR